MRDGYALIDAGDERRLERFGDRLVDRPSPTATFERGDPGAWAAADLVFRARRPGAPGGWVRGGDAAPWPVSLHGLTLELRAAAAGQVGVFPEHAALWRWVRESVARVAATLERPPEVLSLFGYTGGASLAAASAGARVAHVDASRPAVAWARRNAELSGLAGAPVRWLVDDARAFVARERRRMRRYDGVIVDPPTYGHGPSGPAWQLDTDLEPLLTGLAELVDGQPGFALLTAHTPGLGPDVLTSLLDAAFGTAADGADLRLVAGSGRLLELGGMARWRRP